MDWRLPEYTVHQLTGALDTGERLGWHLIDYHVPEAWATSRGRGVRVGIVDTGIDPLHLEGDGDLIGAVASMRDFTSSRRGPVDRIGHGTHVAGIIAARTENGRGVASVAPETELVVAKALGDDGLGTDYSVAHALEHCASEGCHVINMSLGAVAPSDTIHAAIKVAVEAGSIIVCAAGNSAGGVNWPAAYPETIAVSSVGRTGALSRFSCFGSEIDCAGPGEEILSTYVYRAGGYAVLSGTSMAAPFVSGCLALRIAHDLARGAPRMKTRSQARDFFSRAFIDAGPSGQDDQFGIGLPDPRRIFESPPDPRPILVRIGEFDVRAPARAGDLLGISWHREQQ